MLKDGFMRVMITVIALSLAVLALNSILDMTSGPAQAQRPYNIVKTEGPALDVLLVRDIPLDGLKNIHILGDKQTFVVQKSNGFAVYKIDYIERNTK